MVKKILQPQEIEVFYVLPALRRELSMTLKESGKSQKDIAKLLGVTEAAVSQYMSSKRASSVAIPKSVKLVIDSSAKNLAEGKNVFAVMNELLTVARKDRMVCQIHEEFGAEKNCNVCFEEKLITIQ